MASKKMTQMKEVMKEKVAATQAEVKEAMTTTKANVKVATTTALHPFDKEKKEEAKHEAANIKEQAAQAKDVQKEQAHEKRLEATGQLQQVTEPAPKPHHEMGTAALASHEPSQTAVEAHGIKPQEEVLGGVTGKKRTGETLSQNTETLTHPSQPTGSDPTQPIFMVGNKGA